MLSTFMILTLLLLPVAGWAHDSMECRTKAVIEEVRSAGFLASGEINCQYGERKAGTRVYVVAKNLPAPASAKLVGTAVKIETDYSEETGEIHLGGYDEILIGARVGIFVIEDAKGHPARMRRIYGGLVTEDGEIVTDKRFLAARERREHHNGDHKDRDVVIKK